MEAAQNMLIDKVRNLSNLEDNLVRVENKVKRLSCRASDYMQVIAKEEQTGKKKRKREVENLLQDVERVESKFNELKSRILDNTLWKNFSSGDCLAKINEEVDELMEYSKDFDGRLCLEDCENRGEPRVTVKLFGNMSQKSLKTIWDCLFEDKLYNIGIYGKGGVGKTTLVQHIHNKLLKESDFQVLWVTVSQEFSIKGLQDKISKLVKIDLSDEDDEDRRAVKLSRLLEFQQYILILDDVWEEFCLGKIGMALGANNCKLILTTRSSQLCDRMQCQRQFPVPTLNTDEAWDLFKHILGQETVLSEPIKDIAKFVAKECAGLPLGIITVAGSMRGVIDVRLWRKALEQLKEYSIGYREMEYKVFPILEWSFNRLDVSERRCFLYCCLYPEDWEIKRGELINLFIRAELIPRRKTRESEFDHAHAILNKLVKVCMLEVSGDCVKMHDLIRDMAVRITCGKRSSNVTGDVLRFLVKSIEDNSKVLLEQSEWTEDLNAVSFNPKFYSHYLEIPENMSPLCPNLSTIHFREVNFSKFPDSFFIDMDGLKVLDLTLCTSLQELPNCISDRVNLTALILTGCRQLKLMPPLGKLERLRELDLNGTGIEDFPQGLESLVKLERLDMLGTQIGHKIVLEGTFSKLQYLRDLALPMTVVVNYPEIFTKHLQVFTGCLSFTNVCNHFITSPCWPQDYAIAVTESPSSCYELDHSIFVDWKSKKNIVFKGCVFHEGLDAVFLPKDIRELILLECSGLSNVLSLHIMNTWKDLSYLYINSSDVEILLDLSCSSPALPVATSEISEATSRFVHPLENIKGLELCCLPNLLRLIDWELIPSGTFSSLEHLHISNCDRLKKLFSVQVLQKSLRNLTDLTVAECDQLEEIASNDDRGAEKETVFPSNSTGPTTASIEEGFSNLKALRLKSLPQLFNICNSTILGHSITVIWVFSCPKVKRLPLSLPCETHLVIRGSEGWWESLEWDNPSAKDHLGRHFIKAYNLDSDHVATTDDEQDIK